MLTQKLFVIFLATFCIVARGGLAQATPVCAHNVLEYGLTPRLSELQHYFGPATTTGYVNQTNGSYFEIDTRPGSFTFTFMTSGLFDLNLIKQVGTIMFCDDGISLRVVGMGKNDVITLSGGTITFGAGGPKMTFREGSKPALLQRLEAQSR